MRKDRKKATDQITEQRSVAMCPACGSTSAREDANYCLVCGKLLDEDYQPLDSIRSSYRLQRQGLQSSLNAMPAEPRLFEENRNTVSETAWACVVYSMVPYLGILFIPFAFATGGWGYYIAVRQPYLGGRRLSAVSVGVSILVLIVQIVLWWLLYIIPELGLPL